MIFEGSRYRGGFMYKTLAMSAIVSHSHQFFNLLYASSLLQTDPKSPAIGAK